MLNEQAHCTSLCASKYLKQMDQRKGKILDGQITIVPECCDNSYYTTGWSLWSSLLKGTLSKVRFYLFLAELFGGIKAKNGGDQDLIILLNSLPVNKAELVRVVCAEIAFKSSWFQRTREEKFLLRMLSTCSQSISKKTDENLGDKITVTRLILAGENPWEISSQRWLLTSADNTLPVMSNFSLIWTWFTSKSFQYQLFW